MMMIPKLPREPNLSPTRYLYGIWQNLMGNVSAKLPKLPRDPNVAPTPLLNAIWLATQTGGGGLPDQTGHNGEFLTTDGSAASWAAVPGGLTGSTGGNGAADAGKAALFGLNGELVGSSFIRINDSSDPGNRSQLLPGGMNFIQGGLLTGSVGVAALTADRTWTLPDATGTLALLSDIPAAPSSIVGISGTMAQFDTACTDGDFAFRTTTNTFTGLQTVNAANNTQGINLTGAVVGAGITRSLLKISDNWSGATGGTSAPTLLELNMTSGGGSPDYGSTTALSVILDGITRMRIDHGGSILWAAVGMYIDTGNLKFQVPANGYFTWAGDVFLVRDGAASLQLGHDAAGVTNQIFKACDRITSDGVGANLTLAGGRGLNGVGGDIIFATAPTNVGAGVLTDRWKIDGQSGDLYPAVNGTGNIGNGGFGISGVYIVTGSGINVNGNLVVTDRQAGTAAVAGTSAGVGADTVDLATLDAALLEHATAINIIRQALNTHGLTTTV